MIRRALFAAPLVAVLSGLAVGGTVQPSAAAPGAAAAALVYAFPIPGGHAALPQTQVSFRGAVPTAAQIKVTGSSTGVHAGKMVPHSDGNGASFFPDAAFQAGEVVTVKTSLNISGASNGTYQFTVAVPGSRDAFHTRVVAGRVSGDVERYHSRPDLAPAAIRITRNSTHTAPGDLFLGAQSSPVQNGPEIRDWRGNLIWYKRMPANQYISDFRPQRLGGKTVLTWWQGYVNTAIGSGEDVIADDRYNTIHVIPGASGLKPDLHEFQITRRNTALVTSYSPIWWDERAAGGPSRAVILDATVQEIDIPTGGVEFQWDALDHVSPGESYKNKWTNINRPWDFFHVNSMQELGDGNLLISGRNTWAAYKVDRHTGGVIWRLGGKASSFRMGSGTGFVFQHDVEMHANNLVSMFDDGAGPPVYHSQSRALGIRLDYTHKTATEVFSWTHNPKILSYFEGNVQGLSRGDYFVGWGSDPHFSEFNSRGQMIFDAHFVASAFHNRAYRFRWNATPATRPATAASTSGRTTTVWASWNGASNVASWRVLAGSSPTHLRSVKTARSSGFETAISIGAAGYVAVVALDSHGHAISGQSTPIRG